MDYNKNQDLLFDLIKDKGILKQDVFSNIILNFKILKNVLKEILLKGKTKLPSLDNSINKHYFLIKNFLASWNAFTKKKYNTKLPVT